MRRHSELTLLTFLVLIFTARLTAADADNEFAKVDRKIHKEPKYAAEQPLYGLVVLGPKKTCVWMVLDKSLPLLSHYDVLYADLNGNRDLTDKHERITAILGEDGTARFKLPDFVDPESGAIHTEFSLRCSPGDKRSQMVSVKWKGEKKFGGGYTHHPDEQPYSQFATSADKAPILWLNGDGPFTFQQWYPDPLKIGRETDVKLFIGVRGAGVSTFCAFQVHALPEGEGIHGVLHYSTASGEERQRKFTLLQKC